MKANFTHAMRGMTLIEAIIAIALFVAVMTILGAFFVHFGALYRFQSAARDTASSASDAVTAIRAATLQADRVVATRVFSGTSRSSGAATLVLELPSVNATGNVIAGAHDYEAFYATSTMLYRAIDADPSGSRLSGVVILSHTLASLVFSYNAVDLSTATTVSATVATHASVDGRTIGSSQTTTARLRNY